MTSKEPSDVLLRLLMVCTEADAARVRQLAKTMSPEFPSTVWLDTTRGRGTGIGAEFECCDIVVGVAVTPPNEEMKKLIAKAGVAGSRIVVFAPSGRISRELRIAGSYFIPADGFNTTLDEYVHLFAKRLSEELRKLLLVFSLEDRASFWRDSGYKVEHLLQGTEIETAKRSTLDDGGQLKTGSFMDYSMPRAEDLPSFSNRGLIELFLECSRWVRDTPDIGEFFAVWEASGRDPRLLLPPPLAARAGSWIRGRPTKSPSPEDETLAFVSQSEAGAREVEWRKLLSRFELSYEVWRRGGRKSELLLAGSDVRLMRALRDERREELSRMDSGLLTYIEQCIEAQRKRERLESALRQNQAIATAGELRGFPAPAEHWPSFKREVVYDVRTVPQEDLPKLLPMETKQGRNATAPAEPEDLVDFSIFAPAQIAADQEGFAVQVLLHTAAAFASARAMALEIDPSAALRGRSTLRERLERGTTVGVRLIDPNLDIEKAEKTVTWNGELTACTFFVSCGRSLGLMRPTVQITINGVIIGEMQFAIMKSDEENADADSAISYRPATCRRFKRAFFSYCSTDRRQVLAVAQAYRLAGISFFQDVLNLEPGERWARQLYKEIEKSDLFLLFWSKAAAASEWVEKEARFAFALQSNSYENVPAIVPYVLEGPPAPEPPSFLQHLHFDDRIRQVATALVETESMKSRAEPEHSRLLAASNASTRTRTPTGGYVSNFLLAAVLVMLGALLLGWFASR